MLHELGIEEVVGLCIDEDVLLLPLGPAVYLLSAAGPYSGLLFLTHTMSRTAVFQLVQLSTRLELSIDQKTHLEMGI